MLGESFDLLSDDLVLQVFKLLDVCSLQRCSQTCSRFRKLCRNKRLWKNLSEQLPLLRVGEFFHGNFEKACLNRAKQLEGPVNRILVSLKDSTILTCCPSGNDFRVVAGAQQQESNFKMPCWDPYAKFILFTCFKAFSNHVCVILEANGRRKELEVTTPPFYYMWLRDGYSFTYIAEHGAAPLCLYLSNSLEGKIMSPKELCTLTTFFFDACPHDDLIVAHMDGREIGVFDLKTAISQNTNFSKKESMPRTDTKHNQLSSRQLAVITRDAGYFAAPQWLSTSVGDFILYFERDRFAYHNEVLQADRFLLGKLSNQHELAKVEDLGVYFGRKAFEMTSDMKYMAILEESTTNVALPNVQNPTTLKVYRMHWRGDYSNPQMELIEFTDHICGLSEPVNQLDHLKGVRAFQWSPDRQKLLCLIIQELQNREVTTNAIAPTSRRRKRKWESYFVVLDIEHKNIYRFPNIILTSTFVCNFLPFFDQFIKSQTFWSPDSNAFCYVGQHENTRYHATEDGQGLFVQRVSPLEAPRLLIRQVEYATWSPL